MPIWGTGDDGERVTAECRGVRAETVVQDGKWRLELPAMSAGGLFELMVASGDQVVTFRDVWFGDVWLAGGQSNMEWSLFDSAEGESEIPKADLPKLRYYQVPKIAYDDGAEHPASWVVCTPETAPAFSAVAYFFAKRVMEEEDVAIGLIGCNWGGTSASCWVEEQVLEEDEALHEYLEEHRAQLKDFTWEAFAEQERDYQRQVDAFNARQAQGLTGAELGDFPWPPPYSPRSYSRPSGLYHAMLRKAAPYALRGFLFYQGESDVLKAQLYGRLLERLISNWRRDFEDAELPFLFVQLPVWDSNGYPDGDAWPLLREAQWQTAKRVDHAWMAAAWEHGERTDIHPRRKQPVGERLALLALEHVFGRPVESTGPEFGGLQISGGEIVLSFAHAGDGGLQVRGGGPLVGFEVCGADDVYYPAVADVQGTSSVVVRSGEVPEPVAVRYGWKNYSEANLAGATGLPAIPFRTSGSAG